MFISFLVLQKPVHHRDTGAQRKRKPSTTKDKKFHEGNDRNVLLDALFLSSFLSCFVYLRAFVVNSVFPHKQKAR
jgi:hypothetical protein